MRTDDFDYNLPEELIAQEPAAVRDECRLLVMDRASGEVEDRIFKDIIDYLQPGDLLVANETRVMPARLLGAKRGTGGAAEVFLLRECGGPEPRTNRVAFWEVLVRPGKRLKPGSGAVVDFTNTAGDVVLSAEIIDWARDGQRGERVARLSTTLPSLDEALHAVGHTPLPPYIRDYAGDEELYQTVYSRRESSAAAPTAGLHFTLELIERLRERGIGWATVELEVGLDTFRVVDEDDPEKHHIHTEFYTVPQATVDAVNATHAAGGRVIAVGTTSVRSLESAWDPEASSAAGFSGGASAAGWQETTGDAAAQADGGDQGAGSLDRRADAADASAAPADGGRGALVARDREATSLYILPGYEFHVVDALITNFHVPRSTLMMLVSAFSTRENILAAYQHAIDERYRLLSFGDAMFLH
ncbi:S-adenosylmethionine:tRNA ribosyltransferase-isomerase [Adlercreutzia equolifaciens subsp. celatus]|uniref:S-adenosylmethionine:tRNA ribosyltransferase-isomerase n=1 Tax=Adlercreutzia equolifaciens subsp. celatus DSM 18785 TaxID=1121021 RepID=A0A3N0AWM5_9ACTN|nr:S-adenosylmethionine:tRNA ribosyltransferase-isomerase [Adlercreutzia equolifaciens]MCP2076840.1 S-adenosylmethionine:tRNA ribosyltransferase-isomerase [Adlercreutzia equolifaciens subsp. celatus DSM 18785]RFT95225.1 S-adenosylmethionine:tRNA ribosyltransferase-isomerase [Adlercreutzia equolifaciens subsp. celatus]RNL39010.1 S-adenosylmethionine:tRNA ribosyltransferase-isomerase [Adlercreutzia equolifaciens subsp. celatus DSM 18785]BCS56865.1 S-adenosylmethionine:tRNA ribosyltransferase-isom